MVLGTNEAGCRSAVGSSGSLRPHLLGHPFLSGRWQLGRWRARRSLFWSALPSAPGSRPHNGRARVGHDHTGRRDRARLVHLVQGGATRSFGRSELRVPGAHSTIDRLNVKRNRVGRHRYAGLRGRSGRGHADSPGDVQSGLTLHDHDPLGVPLCRSPPALQLGLPIGFRLGSNPLALQLGSELGVPLCRSPLCLSLIGRGTLSFLVCPVSSAEPHCQDFTGRSGTLLILHRLSTLGQGYRATNWRESTPTDHVSRETWSRRSPAGGGLWSVLRSVAVERAGAERRS